MRETLQFVVRHGYALIFFWILAEQAAVPVPLIPGLSAIAAPLAGSSRAKFGRFLAFDSIGALTWISAYVLAGYVFSDQLEDALGYAIRMGSSFVVAVVSLFIAWILWKYFERR